MRRSNSAVTLFAAVLLVAGLLYAPAKASASEAAITCKVESPTDGSFWIGTKEDGLFRLGRNGRTVRYSAQDGQLGSNTICALVFDNQKTLWILDGTGSFRTYSPVHGFQEISNFPEGILVAVQGSNPGTMLFATSDKLYSLDYSSRDISEIASLPVVPQEIQNSREADEIWVFGANGAFKCANDGKVIAWEEAPSISNLLPFIFDTNVRSTYVEGGKSVPVWFAIIISILAFIVGWLIRINPRSSAKEESNPAQIIEDHVKAPVQDAPKPVTPVHTSSNTLGQQVLPVSKPSGAFTKKVIALINENISDPNFDVESIASNTGLSRIHVNRKLKAEGSPSPSTLLKDARMHMATSLLKQGKLTVSQISAQCGFRTPSYFATAFKDYFGISPTEYLDSSRT